MNEIHQKHREAMTIADSAFLAHRQGNVDEARSSFAQAYNLEYEAARLTEAEPSRSILFRSAATLAFHANLFREAEKLVALGLAGDPPELIAEELRALRTLIVQSEG